MIICPHCQNDEKETIHQHDKSLAGYRDYGRFFICLYCRKEFVAKEEDVSQEEIENFAEPIVRLLKVENE